MYSLCTQHREPPVGEQGPPSRIAGQSVGKERREVLGHSLQQDLSLDRVESVPEVELEEDVVRGRLLEPHPDLVYQAFGSPENPNPDLLRLEAAGGLGLVAANEQLTCQPAQRFTHRNRPHATPALAQGNEARPCQSRQARRGQAAPAKSLHNGRFAAAAADRQPWASRTTGAGA